jgi:hypothetical protein
LQGQCTVERIGIVDRLQADRHRLIAAPRHRLQPVSTRQRPVFGEGGVFLRVERTLPQFDFEVAAEQFLPARRDLSFDRRSQSPDRRQRACAQKQADQQKAQSLEPRIQIAPRDPPGFAPGHVRVSLAITPSPS